jgi:hypothetical protein
MSSGPRSIKARFAGKVSLSDIDARRGYTLGGAKAMEDALGVHEERWPLKPALPDGNQRFHETANSRSGSPALIQQMRGPNPSAASSSP